MSMGTVQLEMGDMEGALEENTQAKRIRIATDTLQTPGGANLMKSIGATKCRMGDLQGALEEYVRRRESTLRLALCRHQKEQAWWCLWERSNPGSARCTGRVC